MNGYGQRAGGNPTQQPPRGRAGGQQPVNSVMDIWPNYLQGGYFLSGTTLRPEYLNREHMLVLVGALKASRPELTNHQLRRFFQHCRAIEEKLHNPGTAWNDVQSEFMKLDIGAADAAAHKQGRGAKIPKLFEDFIARNVKAVRDRDTFHGFLLHFEALVGFAADRLRERDRS